MLTVPRLDDLDYQKLFERARAMIPTLTDEWTDFNDHDPGITVLQVFAWLCDNLGYLINSTGEEHRLNYLKLLGIRPHAQAARCRVVFSGEEGGEISLPPGTRMLAGDTVFELEEGFCAKTNPLVKLYAQEGGQLLDLSGFAGGEGAYAKILSDTPGKPAGVLMGFAQPLEGQLRLYIQLEENGRTPFPPDFLLVSPVWEFWDGKAWQKAELVRDETCGLLTSGFVALSLPVPTQLWAGKEMAAAHYLRARLEDGDSYDLAPRMGRVSLSCATVVQTDTAARALELEYDGSGTLPVDCAVGRDDLVSVAVWEKDAWQEWFHHFPAPTDLCAVQWEENRCRIRFDKRKYKAKPEKGARVLVTIVRKGAEGLLDLGVSDGCANQSLLLETADLYRLRLALVDDGPGGRRKLTLYEPCEDLRLAGWNENVFFCDYKEGRLVFGDSIHGVQPPAGLRVEAVDLCFSKLEQGNVMRGQLNRLEGEVPGIAVSNPESAWGGVCMRTSDELESALERKMDAVTRAASPADIRRIVLGTPGLLIDSVAVVSARDYEAAGGEGNPPNTIVAVVKPRSSAPRPVLSDSYRRVILRHLEQHRLLTTRFRVESARYVGIGVFGRVSLVENTPENRRLVAEELERLIDTAGAGNFGRMVDYGRLFSALELFPAVRSVSRLSMEYTGQGGAKNEYGDIVLAPDSLAYLGEVGIEFH